MTTASELKKIRKDLDDLIRYAEVVIPTKETELEYKRRFRRDTRYIISVLSDLCKDVNESQLEK